MHGHTDLRDLLTDCALLSPRFFGLLRDDYIVLVGGAPLNEEFGKAIGADAYCRDAAVAVETAKEFVARKHNQMA